MQTIYNNDLNTERSVEIPFITEMLNKYTKQNYKILDVGGIPSDPIVYKPILETINKLNTQNIRYDICDFRGGKYQGNFVTMDIKDQYDIIMFISSLEHFSQCTEEDVIYREGEDNKGFQKALSLLKDPNSVIFLTVPFGFHKWQPYHQNYDWNGILNLTKGSIIMESYTYRLVDDNKSWKLWASNDMTDIFYTDKAYGVGCFVLKGE